MSIEDIRHAIGGAAFVMSLFLWSLWVLEVYAVFTVKDYEPTRYPWILLSAAFGGVAAWGLR